MAIRRTVLPITVYFKTKNQASRAVLSIYIVNVIATISVLLYVVYSEVLYADMRVMCIVAKHLVNHAVFKTIFNVCEPVHCPIYSISALTLLVD